MKVRFVPSLHLPALIAGLVLVGALSANLAAALSMQESGNEPPIFVDGFEPVTISPPDPHPDPDPPPPDPGNAARSDDLRTGLEFLVSGPNAPQQGFDPTSVDPVHTAALRGRTLLPGGAALADVEVTIAGRPEWGSTMSASDGTWTMLVGGGENLVVSFRRDAHVTVQRKVQAAWNDWRVVDDVVLTPLDTAVTRVELAGNSDQLHTSSVSSDDNGDRQASLLFRAATTATMTLPDGSSQPIGTLDVRATEVTVGSTGLAAMPGELPIGSLYTYAVDVTVDQAEALGASRIDFSQPVTLWIDNFLGFPAGTPAPVGYYDRVQASWVALDVQGIVADVVGVNGGIAELDLDNDGDSDAADQTLADAAGIDGAERQALASRHVAGDSIIRVLVDHFTPFDVNWLPEGEVDSGEESNPEDDERLDEETCEGGASSIIACNNGTLLEHLDVPGALGPLVYDSQRGLGRLENRTVRIPITGSVIRSNTSLAAVEVTVDVAGQRHEYRYDGLLLPDMEEIFVWDGLDAFGREVFGAVTVTVTHTELHAQSYGTGIFGVPPTSGSTGTSVTTRLLTPVTTVWRGTVVARQRPETETVGGWTLPRHHRYDPVSGTVHRGDGSDRGTRGDDRFAALWRLTGNDTQGPGAPSIETSPQASGLALLGDGSVIVAAASEHRLYRITHDGLLEAFAGTGVDGDGGDGGAPVDASFSEPLAVATYVDGSVLVTDAAAGRVRRIGETVEPFAGAAVGGVEEDNVQATAYRLHRPVSTAVFPDGAVLIADAGAEYVLRVGTDGRIARFAGGGIVDNCAFAFPCRRDALDLAGLTDVAISSDGNFIAIAAGGALHEIDVSGQGRTIDIGGLPVRQVAYAPDGGLWIGSELGTAKLRKDGTIAHPNFDIQGGGSATGAIGSSTSGSAVDARDIAVSSQGDVILIDGLTVPPCPWCEPPIPPSTDIDGIMVMTSPLRSWRNAGLPPFGPQVRPGPFTTDAAYLIPSVDGSEIFVFGDGGRHLRTVTADTLILTDSFSYDAEGRLIGHTDADGRTTTIERDASGTATAVVGPEGRRTTLTVTDGWITGSSDPLGRSRTFRYENGLLVAQTDTAANTATYEYSSEGQLNRAVATDGTEFEISEVRIPEGRFVTVLTGGLETRRTETRIDSTSTTATTQQTFPDGSTRVVETASDGRIVVENRDGSASFVSEEDDPRFGALVRFTSGSLLSRGDSFVGDFLDRTSTLEVTQADPLDPFSVTEVRRSLTMDEFGTPGTWTVTTDPAARTVTVVDPVGVTTVDHYDAAGRIFLSELPDGLADVAIAYDGNGRAVSHAMGDQSVAMEYDADGDLIRVELGDGTVREYGHDAAGRLTSTQIAGASTRYTQDVLDVLTGWTTPAGVTHAATVNPARNLVTRSGPPNPITGRSYDAARRAQTVSHGDGRSTTLTYTAGKVTEIDGPEIDTAITYQARLGSAATNPTIDRVVRTIQPDSVTSAMTVERDFDTRNGLPIAVEVAYDRTGDGVSRRRHFSNQRWSGLLISRREVDFDVSSRVEMAYNAARRLVQEGPWVIDRSGPAGSAASYEASLPGGTITQSITVDAQGLLAGREIAVDGVTLGSVELTRNGAGRVISRRVVLDGTEVINERYGHDARGFLASVTDPLGAPLASNSFDADGNRTAVTQGGVTETSVFDASGIIVEHDGAAISTDTNGMVDSLHGWTLDHAASSELLVATDGNATIYYGYDEQGRRIARQVENDVTIYLYGDLFNPERVTDVVAPDGTLTQYLYDEAGHVYAVRRDGTWYGVLSDSMGTPLMVVDENATIVDLRIFDPWGRPVLDSNPAFDLALGFAAGLQDADTGLVRFGRRDYDPVTGRWLSPDPTHLPGGAINLYRYASNDPVSYRDPVGRFTYTDARPIVPGAVAILDFTLDETGYSACFSLGGGFDMGPAVDILGEHEQAGESQQANLSMGPFGIEVPLDNPSECELDYPLKDMDPSGVDDLVDLASEINKHGWRAVGETVRGTRGTITQKWCSGTYAW
ncbi:MAG: RHS repeat-associated core domain-containing protein [Xanthomonadales bacterium]|nr:RHS repeat-associated core domain-containing protein [Xanthomonadales bacterium]